MLNDGVVNLSESKLKHINAFYNYKQYTSFNINEKRSMLDWNSDRF